jgi:hypothetical protein
MSLGTAERRLLAEMPLHAITSVHGELGLRERLAIEIAGFPPADRTGCSRPWRWRPSCTRPTGASASRT